MIEMCVLLAVALLITGAVIGILTVVAVGIRREEKAHSLTIARPGKITNGVRAANGVYARKPGVAQTIYPRREPVLAGQGGPRS
jgi:hypothetical protein